MGIFSKGTGMVLFLCLALLLGTTAVAAEEAPDTLDIQNGDITFSRGNEVYQNGRTYTLVPGKSLRLTGSSTAHSVRVDYGAGLEAPIHLVLDNLLIDQHEKSGQGAFIIVEDTQVVIELPEGTESQLLGGEYRAGLQVQSKGGKYGQVKIIGNGALTAVGGKNAAGIGGGNDGHWYGSGGKITVEGGDIHAVGGDEGAGIGGGFKGDGGNLSLSGGKITALGGVGASGIGGGHYGLGGNIDIKTDAVDARPGAGAEAIGNGADYQQKLDEETQIEVNMGDGSAIKAEPTAEVQENTPGENTSVTDDVAGETGEKMASFKISVMVGGLVVVAVIVGVILFKKRKLGK